MSQAWPSFQVSELLDFKNIHDSKFLITSYYRHHDVMHKDYSIKNVFIPEKNNKSIFLLCDFPCWSANSVLILSLQIKTTSILWFLHPRESYWDLLWDTSTLDGLLGFLCSAFRLYRQAISRLPDLQVFFESLLVDGWLSRPMTLMIKEKKEIR